MTQSEMVRPIFIGRWTPKIMFSLKERPFRHGHLRRRLGSISQRMLTRNLRQLESSGLVSRRVMHSKAIAVEYSLTQLGRTLVAPLEGVCRWAKRHQKNVMGEVHVSRPVRPDS
jgi:DNA-binding HxlR family transcriptional regulator